ncbi:MAG: hypothetical protein JXR37_10605 [Kiritimatiellae bacterium]|nr:hypothetical protein [Kiritimatiellia bacterium]
MDNRLSAILVWALAALLTASLHTACAQVRETTGPVQVEIELQFVEFQLADLEPVTREGAIDMPVILALRQKGKGRLLAAPKVVTCSGQNATVKGVKEYIYPTEYEVSWPKGTNVVAASSPAVVPAALETREGGAVLNVTPTLAPDRELIDLILQPEFVWPPVWKDYGWTSTDPAGNKKEFRAEQPFFHSCNLCTHIVVHSGAPVLVGGGLPGPDGTTMVYALVTARIVDARGELALKE